MVLKDRTFGIAILISLMWHIFWLSVITVVVAPKETKAVKFSTVSFLGPILGKGALEVRIRPRERSMLEKRYLANSEKISKRAMMPIPAHNIVPVEKEDRNMAGVISDAVGGLKIEPDDNTAVE